MTISKRTQYDHVLEVIEPVPGSGLRVMRCKVCGGVPPPLSELEPLVLRSLEPSRAIAADKC